jgi:N6-adenine-specific methylase
VGKGDAGAHLRSTTDRVRESLFNILMGGRFGDPITGARVLYLSACTGALGARGAVARCGHVTFCL